MLSKNKLLIAGSLIVLLLCILVFWSNHEEHQSASYQRTSINPDTGQTIINTPNQQSEKGGGSNQVTILGDGTFITAGMTQAQFTLAEELITNYVNKNLHGQYKQVSILTNGFSSTGTSLTAKMRLGSSSILLNLTIKYYDLSFIDLGLRSPTGNAYFTYDSGQQVASS